MTSMRGTVTRLIDITLIILVGFLSVADLDDRSALPLPAGLAARLDTLSADAGSRRLQITATDSGRFALELSSTTGLTLSLGEVGGPDTLRAVLARLKGEHSLEGVDVEARPAAPLQAAVEAVDACDLLELPREVRLHEAAEARP